MANDMKSQKSWISCIPKLYILSSKMYNTLKMIEYFLYSFRLRMLNNKYFQCIHSSHYIHWYILFHWGVGLWVALCVTDGYFSNTTLFREENWRLRMDTICKTVMNTDFVQNSSFPTVRSNTFWNIIWNSDMTINIIEVIIFMCSLIIAVYIRKYYKIQKPDVIGTEKNIILNKMICTKMKFNCNDNLSYLKAVTLNERSLQPILKLKSITPFISIYPLFYPLKEILLGSLRESEQISGVNFERTINRKIDTCIHKILLNDKIKFNTNYMTDNFNQESPLQLSVTNHDTHNAINIVETNSDNEIEEHYGPEVLNNFDNFDINVNLFFRNTNVNTRVIVSPLDTTRIFVRFKKR